jgi:hypothetical protein
MRQRLATEQAASDKTMRVLPHMSIARENQLSKNPSRFFTQQGFTYCVGVCPQSAVPGCAAQI